MPKSEFSPAKNAFEGEKEAPNVFDQPEAPLVSRGGKLRILP